MKQNLDQKGLLSHIENYFTFKFCGKKNWSELFVSEVEKKEKQFRLTHLWIFEPKLVG